MQVFRINSTVYYTVLAFVLVGSLIIIGLLGVVIWFREKPVIIASSPFWSGGMLLGFLILIPSSMLYVEQPISGKDYICHARVWLCAMPLVLVIAILFAKTNRVFRVRLCFSICFSLI